MILSSWTPWDNSTSMALMQDPPVATGYSQLRGRCSTRGSRRLTQHRVEQETVPLRNVIRQLRVLGGSSAVGDPPAAARRGPTKSFGRAVSSSYIVR